MRFLLIFFFLLTLNEYHNGCTSIIVGKKASTDKSVMTSHTCDSHRTRTSIFSVPAKDYPQGEMTEVKVRVNKDDGPMPYYFRKTVGKIPQIERTFHYISTAYACVNEKQLAVGESTFGGRKELRGKKGLLDCVELCRLIMERCSTAKQAIFLIDSLTKKYGYNDGGECLTIADPEEAWYLEILGAGKDKIGAVWAARRLPDDHVAVVANTSRLREIHITDTDNYLASSNLKEVAIENGWWDPESGKPFEFCYAYSPKSRYSMSGRRREWRVYDLLAPSLNLNPNSENYPFSVKPDSLVSPQDIMAIFSDYYEDTEYDITKNITVKDTNDQVVKSPLANPFMPYDMLPLFKINGGWHWRGERSIARWYCVYSTVIQLRRDLPDAIGGLAWISYDNPASSVYVPYYCHSGFFPKSYQKDGRKGFSRECAWWAFNRLGTLAAQRWGDMRHDVYNVRDSLQNQMNELQSSVEEKALKLYDQSPQEAVNHLTSHSNKWSKKCVKAYWDLGDFLWTKYDEKF